LLPRAATRPTARPIRRRQVTLEASANRRRRPAREARPVVARRTDMDSVELARQAAASFTLRLIASGADSLVAYDFAVAEAKRRGSMSNPTAAGAAVLNGGRATFVAADDLILHESVGSPFEQAFLVAHEIGHVELGDDPDGEPAPTIDPGARGRAVAGRNGSGRRLWSQATPRGPDGPVRARAAASP